MDSSGLGQSPIVGFCEYGNELSDSINLYQPCVMVYAQSRQPCVTAAYS
jgi:hypothetical protein